MTVYAVKIINGLNEYTLYEGVSKARAERAIVRARAVLVLGRGSATLSLAADRGVNVDVLEVVIQDGTCIAHRGNAVPQALDISQYR